VNPRLNAADLKLPPAVVQSSTSPSPHHSFENESPLKVPGGFALTPVDGTKQIRGRPPATSKPPRLTVNNKLTNELQTPYRSGDSNANNRPTDPSQAQSDGYESPLEYTQQHDPTMPEECMPVPHSTNFGGEVPACTPQQGRFQNAKADA